MTRSAASPDWSRGDLLVVPVLLAAVGLRIWTAGYSLWFDEIAAMTFARQPLELLWSGWMARESNPPLYYTLLGAWTGLFGTSDRAAQMLSVAIGTAGLVAAWLLARRVGGTRAGVLAALLLALSPVHFDYSQEVRGYILAQSGALCASLAMFAFVDRPRWPALLGYALGALAALYSHTTMAAFVLLANLAMVWLLRRDRPALTKWLAANLLVASLWGWWAWISLGQVGAGSGFGWIPPSGATEALRMTAVTYLPLYVASDKVAFAPVLALAWLAGLLWFAARDRRPAVILLATLALGAPLLLWAASQFVPVFLPRTLFWASGPMLALVGVALAGGGRVGLVLAGLLLALSAGALLRWLPTRESEAWPQAIAAAAAADPRGVLLVQGDAMAVAARHYLVRTGAGLRLVILDRAPGGGDRWADRLIDAPRVDAGGAGALLGREKHVFALRRGDYDVGAALGPIGVEQSLPAATRDRQPRLSLWRLHPGAVQAALWSIPSSPSLRYSVERPIPSRRATSVIRPR